MSSATDTIATGINYLGQIVGYYVDPGAAHRVHGFLYSKGVFSAIDDPAAVSATQALGINSNGQVVGSYVDANGQIHGFLESNNVYTTLDLLPTTPETLPTGISDSGQIVGANFIATPQSSPPAPPPPGANAIFLHNTLGGQNLVWNLVAGQYVGGASLPTTPSTWVVAGAGDFNSDGVSDLFWHKASTGNLIWVMGGNQVMANASPPTTPI